MLRASRLLPCAALLLAFGCGPSSQYFGGVRRDKYYRSIVSLSPSTTELLYTTTQVMADRLTGKTAYDNYPKVGYEKVPVVASVKPDYEKIASIHPQLIAYDADLYNAADIAKIKSLGADLFVIDAENLDDFEKELYALGSAVGGETYLSDYVDRIEQAREAGKAMTNHPTVAVIDPGKGGSAMIDGKSSFDGSVVEAAGGTMVGPDGQRFVPIDPEFLAKANPDFLVTAGDPTAFMKDPKYSSLKAVKLKQIIPVDPDILLRRGSRVDTLIQAINHEISK